MKIHNVDQNGEQWHELRRFIVTASEMHRVICAEMGSLYKCSRCGHLYANARKWCDQCSKREAPVDAIPTVKPSASQDGYMYKLIAQSMGAPIDQGVPNRFMEHGHEQEANAVAEYEFQTGNDTEKVGFCTTDDGLIGASPDRLVGVDGLLECKCPAVPAVHIRHMIEGDLESDHKVQVQAQLMVTGRKWCDVISFYAGFPSVIIRVERDDEFIEGMNTILVDFITRLHKTRAEMIKRYGDFSRLPKGAVPDEEPELGLNISPQDVSDIFAAASHEANW